MLTPLYPSSLTLLKSYFLFLLKFSNFPFRPLSLLDLAKSRQFIFFHPRILIYPRKQLIEGVWRDPGQRVINVVGVLWQAILKIVQSKSEVILISLLISLLISKGILAKCLAFLLYYVWKGLWTLDHSVIYYEPGHKLLGQFAEIVDLPNRQQSEPS